jgi:hypothetical protein
LLLPLAPTAPLLPCCCRLVSNLDFKVTDEDIKVRSASAAAAAAAAVPAAHEINPCYSDRNHSHI